MADFLRVGGITRLDRLDDGRVACVLCHEFFTVDELNPVEGGGVEDVCIPCAQAEDRLMEQTR
jgi:hypothetical protein